MVKAYRSGTMGLVRDLLDGGTFADWPDARLIERFVVARDEAAFKALVTRHGGMVWNTCRAVLKESNAVDDAFQATFILLFRKAGTIRGGDALGCWLHRVAYRVAVQAAGDEARRRRVEQLAGALRPGPAPAVDDRDAILHEEVERLPDRFRLPLVLRDLEGLTLEQASERLGLTEGSVRGRLAKGRELLRRRLTRRGIAPALPIAGAGAIPETLVASTARSAGGEGSSTVEALVRAIVRGATLARGKVVAAALLAVGSSAMAFVLLGKAEEPPRIASAHPRVAPALEPFEPLVDDPKAAATIEGRILDLEGRPVVGATIEVDDIEAAPDGKFDAWVDEIKRFNRRAFGPRVVVEGGRDRLSAKAGRDGRFRIEKMPRDAIVSLSISGPGIETSILYVLTRDLPTFRVKEPQSRDGRFSVYHGLTFDHPAAPSRSIVGTVRDKDSRAPIAGVHITGMPDIPNSTVTSPGIEATSDMKGHYEVNGLPTSQGFKLFTEVPSGQPYVNHGFVAPPIDPKPGVLNFDLDLKRGVLVRGRLTDKATGQVVRGSINYYPFLDNALIDQYPNALEDTQITRVIMDLSGRFTIAALPGRGLITARAQEERYLHGIGAEAIEGFDKKAGWFRTYPHYCPTSDQHVYAEIDPAPGTVEVTLDLQVDPGRTVRGEVVGPDGKAITDGVSIRTLDVFQSETDSDRQGHFEVTGLPAGPYRLDFFHKPRKLAGSINMKGDEKDEVVVKLQPWGTVTGRVVDEEGKPRTDVEIFSTTRRTVDPARGDLDTKPMVDAQGRFRIEGLVPGVKYDALGHSPNKATGPILDGVQVGPDEVKDLGDVRLPSFKKKG